MSSIKKSFMFYNILMLIFPIVVSLIAFELSTSLIEDKFIVRNETYEAYIRKSSELIEVAESIKDFELSTLEDKANEIGYVMYVSKDGEEVYENLTDFEESIVKSVNVINYDVVYQVGGKIAIATKITYPSGTYEMIFVSRNLAAPFMNITIVQLLLVSIIVVLFVAVGISNYVITGKMVNSFSKPLSHLSSHANKIREGDLTSSVGNADIKEFVEVYDTFELMRKELKSNIDKNIKYEKSRKEMLAGISHDLKTPLTVIQGYSKGLLDGVAKNEEQTKKYLEAIMRKSIEMEGLLNQLTIFSSLENESFVLKQESKNLSEFLKTFMKNQKTTYLNKKISFKYINSCPDINVSIDTFQINRVLENIFINSIKYNDNSNVLIKINVYLSNPSTVNMEISDNGIGVAEKDIEHIFESFYRVDVSRSTKVEGNGLGLAICKSIVEKHGGSISAYSVDGLTIKISLPIGE